MHDVFISYSRKDKDFVDSLIAFFDQQQVSYFCDTQNLPAAVIWRDELKNAIIDADNLLFVISPDSVGSKICLMELEYADEYNKRLIPIRYRSTNESAIPHQLSKWQMLLFNSEAREKTLNETLRIIRKEHEWHKQGSDYLRRAENWRINPNLWGFLAREELASARAWLEKGSTMKSGTLPIQLHYIGESEAFHLQEAEKVQQLYSTALARQLAAQSQVMIDQQGVLLDCASLLAVESMRRLPTLEGDQAIRKALFLLPRKIIDIDLPNNQSIRDLAFSQSGQQVAAIIDEGAIKVWNTLSGNMILEITAAESRKLMFSSSENYLIVLGDSVKVVDVSSGKEVTDLNQAGTIDVAVSHDGGFLATLGKDSFIRLWDTDNWDNIACYRNQSSMYSLALARDAREIISWNSGQAEIFTSPGGPDSVMQLEGTGKVNFTYSPDGKYLSMVAPLNYSVTVYHVASRQQIIFEERHWNVSFSGNSEYFAIASPEWDAQVYFLPSTWWVGHYSEFTPQATVIRKHIKGRASSRKEAVVRHDNSINSVVLSQSGRYLATTSRDRTARVWESVRGREVLRLLESEQYCLSNFYFHRNERYVSAQNGHGFCTWEISGHRQVAELSHKDGVYNLCFSHDNSLLATISRDRTCRLLDIAENAEILCYDFAAGGEFFHQRDILFSPDSRQLLIDRQHIFDIETGNIVGLDSRGYQQSPMAVTDDWQYSAGLEDNSVITLHDFNNAAELKRSPSCQQKITMLLINNVSRSIVAVTEVASLFIWNWDKPEIIKDIPVDDLIRRVAISDSGNRLAVLYKTDKSKVTVWDLARRQAVNTITQESEITDISFDPTDCYLVTSSSDFKARIWHLNRNEQISQFRHDADVGTVKFSYGDGRYVASAGGRSDRCARVWLWQPEDLIAEACARMDRDLTQEEWQQYLGLEPYRATRTI